LERWCAPFASGTLRKREQSMGVSVNATRSETRMAQAAVMPKLKKRRPMRPCMKATGTKITTRDSVVAMTARPISRVASTAASIGARPSSSM